MRDAYNPLKILHHQDRINQLRDGQQIVPTQVQLVLSDFCNQNCSFCAYRMENYLQSPGFTSGAKLATTGTNNPVRMIPFDKVMEILNDCAAMGVQAVQITGGGEPTTHPKFKETVAACHALGLDVGLVTNGVLLRKEYRNLLVQSQWIRVSLDSGTPETYRLLRRCPADHWGKMWDNVQGLVEWRKRAGSAMVIGLSYVVTRENQFELRMAAQLAMDAGVDYIRFAAMFSSERADYYKGWHEPIKEVCADLKRTMQSDTFRVFDSFGGRWQDLQDKAPEHPFCGYQQFSAYIGGDQKVYRCCVNAYSDKGLVGSLKDQSFRELWGSRDKHENFKNFDARTCIHCYVNDKNRILRYAVTENPEHVNFV